MRVNLHTHTIRCGHASGAERDYIENAIKAGIEVLGFSDHAPMLFPGDYYSTMRMYPAEAAGYFETLLRLREEYRNRIELLIGMEIEYYPLFFGPTMDFLSQFPLDYVILGQHYMYNEIGSPPVSAGSDSSKRLRHFVDQCCEALDTGRFTYVAHPDVFRFTGNPAVYEEEMERLCRKALETDTPLELNLLGAGAGRHYPDERFWAIAGRVGNQAVLGSDAHKPEALLSKKAEAHCLALAKRHGLTVLDSVPIKNPF